MVRGSRKMDRLDKMWPRDLERLVERGLYFDRRNFALAA
jgi:hypothetical protein